ncbi:MAG: toll/interleukin-1 receptor domain-containing protein, partial [Verrucomicrobiaceae bacterium]
MWYTAKCGERGGWSFVSQRLRYGSSALKQAPPLASPALFHGERVAGGYGDLRVGGRAVSFVVISYCREDLPLVEKIADALLAKGHFAWYDKRIEQGDSWRLRIQGKIEESAATLVIWTKNSKDSKFVIDEARLAEKHGRLVQVLAGSAPALGFGEAHGFELDPNAEFNDKNLDWLKIVNEVTQRLKAMGWDTDVARERMDWGDWCQRKRQEVLRSLSSRAFERGIVFLYGDRAWNDAHLSALASSCAEQQVQEANPRPEEFARMLSFAEKLHKETDEFDSRFLGISAMMAATAYEFAQRAALTPKAGGTLSPVSLQNPSAFANVFFTRRVPFPDGPRSLLEMTTARGCVEFFLRFVQKIVDEEAGSETRYILIWPVSLIETLLLDANRVFDDQVKRVVADPASFAERFLVGVRDVVDAGAVPGRVGLVVRSQKFPCPKNYQVAKQCVLMMPPLDPAEMRDLILDTFGAQSEAWNFARITQLTGGL